LDPENDTGILVTYLSQTIEESRRLREDLKQGRPDTRAPEPRDEAPPPPKEDDVTSPDPLSPPG
jgi:hypothetical protein